MSSKVLVVVGSGPGIGVTTAALFGSKGFNAIALIARNADRLENDARTVHKSAQQAKIITYPTDVSDTAALDKTFSDIERDLGTPEVVLFNAARIAQSSIGEESPSAVLKDFQVMNIGLYKTMSWAKPLLEAAAKDRSSAPYPSFFLSGGFVYAVPVPTLFSLSMNKAAQHNLMKSLEMTVKDKGIHVGVTNIGGIVSDDEPERNAKNIANTYWALYNEGKNEWRHQVDIGVDRSQ